MNIKYIEGDEYLPSGYYCKVGNVFYLIEDLINNKDKEIERLNNIINNDFAKICKEKMIDKLSANEMILLQEKEIERLNNIINELEKYLNEQIQKSWEIEEQCYEDIESKVQELKGSDK